MKNYVISLTSATARRQHIQQEFAKHSIDFEFFNAITPEQAIQLASRMRLPYDASYLSAVELACLMSHVCLWQQIFTDKMPYMAIFEDDIYLGEHASSFLSQEDWHDSHWDILKLEVTQFKVILGTRDCKQRHNRAICPLKYPHLGAGGYMLSCQAAIKLLDYIGKMPYLLPADEILFRNLINHPHYHIMQLVPALCVQDIIINPHNEYSDFKSHLIQPRGTRMHQQQHTLFFKLIREIKRLVNQFKLAVFAQKIDFK